MTVYQNRVMCAFRDMKIKSGHKAFILVRNNVPGVLVNGRDFYTMNAILDPINRYINAYAKWAA